MNVTFCLNDGTALLEPGELTEGTVVAGKYRIIARTGQADMSTLYKALHLRLDEVRALKVMNAELARDPLFLKRFEQEALLTRKLQHPNVLRVDDIEETEDGRPFMVMEYIEGKTLKEVIKEEGPLAAWRACSIGRQVASALDAAHQLGMIHRDIKPDNIELVQTPSGEQAKVLEFGVAKMKEARRDENAGMLTLSGAMAIIGTPQYMSPELCMGKRGDELDGRSDLYTLGIVMYEMLTAALPFKSGTMMNMIMAHVQTPPAPIQSARAGVTVPEPLANLVMKCLEKERDSRPASAKALVEELDTILESLPVPAGVKKPAPPAEAPAKAAQSAAVLPPKGTVAPAPPVPEPPPPAPAIPAAQPRAEVHVEPVAATKPANAIAEAPITRPAEPAPMPPAKSSGGMIWIALVAVVVLALGGWYFLRSRNSSDVSPAPATSEQPAPAPKAQPVSEPKAEPAATAPAASQEASQPAQVPAKESTASTTAGAAESRTSAASRRELVAAATKQGDLFYQNGQYDNAIREYEKGLSADPSSSQLRQKIDRAKRAKATEEALQ